MNRIARRTLLALCLPLVAACGGGGGGGTPPAVAVFYIVASTPAINAQGAPRTPLVFVTFNKEIDAATIDDESLTVGAVGAGLFPGTTTLFVDGTNRTLRWTGPTVLAEAATHVVTIAPSLRSADGDPVDAPTQFGFRTVGGPGPLVLPGPSNIRNAVGTLNTGRQGHTATRLAGGNVFIAGGLSIAFNVTDSAEVYNAGGEVFTELTNRMDSPRTNHTSTLLNDGRVLITGGQIPGPTPGSVLSTDTAEIFNPGNLTFTPIANMTTQRYDHAALLLPDGRVLVTGGSFLVAGGGSFVDLDSSEIFDPATGQFTAGPQMVHTRATHVMLDTGLGWFALSGGSDVDVRSSRFNLTTFQFEDLGQGGAEEARFFAAGDVFKSGAVSVSGGDGVGQVIYIYTSGLVQNSGSGTTFPRGGATATRYADDKILIAGGIRPNSFIEASCDVVVEGGVGGSQTFAAPMRLPTGMVGHTATTLLNGTVLLCGGANEDFNQPNKTNAFLFTP